ncbi:hypothetical protein EIZ62_29085 [Streptomyces ficellus]|uniref:Uncharacterized protein n=1 Tax=Streptomyces ficellus TaxID=1977088 RepID=A0A6I6FFT2_9ACTN|nr:hypothetical protein EIZ62_29085 [Streptomyces ficellus]
MREPHVRDRDAARHGPPVPLGAAATGAGDATVGTPTTPTTPTPPTEAPTQPPTTTTAPAPARGRRRAAARRVHALATGVQTEPLRTSGPNGQGPHRDS